MADARFSARAGSPPTARKHEVANGEIQRIPVPGRNVAVADRRLEGTGVAEVKPGEKGGAVQEERGDTDEKRRQQIGRNAQDRRAGGARRASKAKP